MVALSIESVAHKIAELAALSMGKDPSDIERSKPLDSQGVDSLGFAEFLFEVEDLFGISLAEKESVRSRLKTINDLAAYIVAEKSGATA